VWCTVHDIEVVENLVDVLFPQSTGFGISARLEHWYVVPTNVNFLFMARAILVGVSIANPNICRLDRRRGVVSAVCAYHDGLVDARGIR
jgi:hypothetical protein